MNALTLIQATVEPQTLDLTSCLRGLRKIKTHTQYSGSVVDCYAIGKLVLWHEQTDWDDDALLHGLYLCLDQNQHDNVILVLLDENDSALIRESEPGLALAFRAFVAEAKKLEARIAGRHGRVVPKPSSHALAHDFHVEAWRDYQKDVTTKLAARYAVTATVEPQAGDPEQVLARAATQLGWHRDDHDGHDDANVSMYKRVTESLGLRVSADNRDPEGHARVFVEIHEGQATDNFYLEATLNSTNCKNIQAWASNPTVIKAFLRDLETELRADNPKPVRLAYGHDKYKLDPLTGFHDVIRRALRAARA